MQWVLCRQRVETQGVVPNHNNSHCASTCLLCCEWQKSTKKYWCCLVNTPASSSWMAITRKGITPMCLPPVSRTSPLMTNLSGLPPPYCIRKQSKTTGGGNSLGMRLWMSCTVYNLMCKRRKKISPKKEDLWIGCHTPPLKKAKKQGEIPSPSLSPIPLANEIGW